MAATTYYDDKRHTLEHFGGSPHLKDHELEELDEHGGPSSRQSDSNFLTPLDTDSSIHREPSGSPELPNPNRFTYIDEDFNYYPSQDQSERSTETQAPLVYNAADVGRSDLGGKSNYQDLGMSLVVNLYTYSHHPSEYASDRDLFPPKTTDETASPMARFLGRGRYPIEQQIEDKRRGLGRQKYPFVGMSGSTVP